MIINMRRSDMKKKLAVTMALAVGISVGSWMLPSVSYAEIIPEDRVVEDIENSVFKVAVFGEGRMAEAYRLEKYDTLTLFAPALYDTYRVNDIQVDVDGKVRLPYVGGVSVAGLTVNEARDLMYSKLSYYYKMTDFDVSVKKYGERKVYVTCNVKKPGVQLMNVDNMNVYAAITTAGGVDNRGRSKHVQILRQIEDRLYFKEVNMDAFVKQHDITQNLEIKDGDIIYVPDSGKIVWKEDIAPYISIYSVYRSIVK